MRTNISLFRGRFYRLRYVIPLAFLITSCTQDLLWSDDLLSTDLPADNLLEVSYEVESTVYRYFEDQSNPLAQSRSVPSIDRKRVDLKINRGGQVEVFTEQLPTSTTFEINESLPSTEAAVKYYHYKNGILKLYDKSRNVISEIESPMLRDKYAEMANTFMEKAANHEGFQASLTAGILWDLENYESDGESKQSASTINHRASTLRNEYDEHEAYQVIRNPYHDDDGAPFISELIIHKDTKTLRYLTDYNQNNEAVMRCFFKYGFENGNVQLKAVYEEHIIEDDVLGRSKEVVVSNYDHYNINFNL